MKYFNAIDAGNISEVRALFHEFCLKMHPDKGGDHDVFVSMNAEYETVISRAAASEAGRATAEDRRTGFTFAGEKEIARMIAELMKVPGIVIEICGSWLWIGGETFTVHEQLKALGFKFSGKKKMWYWSPYMGAKRKRGRYSMEKIRDTFGSYLIENEDGQKAIAG